MPRSTPASALPTPTGRPPLVRMVLHRPTLAALAAERQSLDLGVCPLCGAPEATETLSLSTEEVVVQMQVCAPCEQEWREHTRLATWRISAGMLSALLVAGAIVWAFDGHPPSAGPQAWLLGALTLGVPCAFLGWALVAARRVPLSLGRVTEGEVVLLGPPRLAQLLLEQKPTLLWPDNRRELGRALAERASS